MSAHLSVCRKIDDKLLECGLQIDNKITLNFNMSNCHGNDARAGSHECRLCTSAIAGQSSDWYLCRALLNHGRIDNVDLVTPKHMKAVPKQTNKVGVAPADAEDGAESLTQSERVAAIGPIGAETVLHDLVMGRGSSDSNKTRKVITLDMKPVQLQWFEACWSLHLKWLAGEDVPCLVYTTNYKSDETSECEGAKSVVQGTVMRTWWENHPDAGSPEPPSLDTSVDLPKLSLMTFSDRRLPIIPEVVLSHFGEESAHYDAWKTLCANVHAKIASMRGVQTSAAVDTAGSHSKPTVVAMTGPEVLSTEMPFDTSAAMILPSTPSKDFDMLTVLLSCSHAIMPAWGTAPQLHAIGQSC